MSLGGVWDVASWRSDAKRHAAAFWVKIATRGIALDRDFPRNNLPLAIGFLAGLSRVSARKTTNRSVRQD